MTDSGIWMGLATIVAIVVGPMAAVWTARRIDDYRASKARKLDIFRSLMTTRGVPLNWVHVSALNLIQVEFIDYPEVVGAWKNYFNNLKEESPPIEQENFNRFAQERDSLLVKLIDEIAKVLKIKIEQLDILEKSYVPQGWVDVEWEQQFLRHSFIDVLRGKKAISVLPFQPNQE